MVSGPGPAVGWSGPTSGASTPARAAFGLGGVLSAALAASPSSGPCGCAPARGSSEPGRRPQWSPGCAAAPAPRGSRGCSRASAIRRRRVAAAGRQRLQRQPLLLAVKELGLGFAGAPVDVAVVQALHLRRPWRPRAPQLRAVSGWALSALASGRRSSAPGPAGGAGRQGRVRVQAGPGRGRPRRVRPAGAGAHALPPGCRYRWGRGGSPPPGDFWSCQGPGDSLGGTRGAGGTPQKFPRRRVRSLLSDDLWPCSAAPRIPRASGVGRGPQSSQRRDRHPLGSVRSRFRPARKRAVSPGPRVGGQGAGRGSSFTGARAARALAAVTKCGPAHPAAATCGHVRPGRAGN